MSPSALVVVPTHDHASTLDLAVKSALDQNVSDLEVVIIGDGVGDDTRDVVAELRRMDERVTFVDRAKSPSRAESTRHEVVRDTVASVVTYLGDDDLLLPHHLEVMMRLLEEHDFAHPMPTFIGLDELVEVAPVDLSRAACRDFHQRPHRNTVSLTGASHTSDLYRRLPFGWRTPPPGRWSDHYMWQQILSVEGIRATTADRATTVKRAAATRDESAIERRDALQRWYDRRHDPGFVQRWDDDVAGAIRASAADTFVSHHELSDRLDAVAGERDGLAAERDAVAGERDRLAAERDHLCDQLAGITEELDAIRSTRTFLARAWLLRSAPLRRLARRDPSGPASPQR